MPSEPVEMKGTSTSVGAAVLCRASSSPGTMQNVPHSREQTTP